MSTGPVINPVYVLDISQLDTMPQSDGLSDVVSTIHYRYNATCDYNNQTYYASVYGTCAAPVPTSEDFIPYSQLTKEIVCQWVGEAIDLEASRQVLYGSLLNQINPPIVNLPLPWDTTPTIPSQ